MKGADLSGARMNRAYFVAADLLGADFSGAVMDEAFLSGAVLGGAKFTGASLKRARLGVVHASFPNPSGRPTSFKDADLEAAVVGATDFRGTDLRGANLNGAFLYEARLRGAIVDKRQFETAVTRAESF